MPAPTATINGVTLTEAQVQEASAQIEAAKRAAFVPIRVPYDNCAYAYLDPAVVNRIAVYGASNPGKFAALDLEGDVFTPSRNPSTFARMRAFGPQERP